MPTAYSLDPMHRLVRTRAWGSVSNEELRDYYHRLAGDGRFHPDFRELVDLRGVLIFHVDSMMIAEVAAWPIFDAGVRRAIIAFSDIAFGLSRMFATYADAGGQDVQVFRNARAAEEWLESPDGVVPDLPPACAA
ncbi:MAG: hypothetical protein ACHQRK_05660 [Gemmatimonadales bacterium]